MSNLNPPFPNDYYLRTVAEASSQPCYVCHKSSVKVLITPNNKDFFYTCPTHLTDRNFASPVLDPKVEAERREKEALRAEIEQIKKEWEEKQAKKRKKNAGWFSFGGGGDDKKAEAEKKKQEKEDKEEEKAVDDKLKALEAKAGTKSGSTDNDDDGPRQFTLHRAYYQMRLDRRKNIERNKREQERLKDPTFFPAVPKGDIS